MTCQDIAGSTSRAPKFYDYVGVFGASGLDLVRITGREESSYLLLDVRTRSRVELYRFPVPSPSNRFYAVASPEKADRRGGVEVVERTATGVKSLVTIPRADLIDDPCRLTNLTWLADDRFVVRAARPGPGGSKGPGVAVTYRLSDGKWKPGA
jgi:hypothetical protein